MFPPGILNKRCVNKMLHVATKQTQVKQQTFA